jgi:hypothetical protein
MTHRPLDRIRCRVTESWESRVVGVRRQKFKIRAGLALREQQKCAVGEAGQRLFSSSVHTAPSYDFETPWDL